MIRSEFAKGAANFTYDTLVNLVLDTPKNESVDYEYNQMNQLVRKVMPNTKSIFTATTSGAATILVLNLLNGEVQS